MRYASRSTLILLLLAAGLAAARPSAAQTSVPLGYEAWFVTDPRCPCSADSMEFYIVYGYQDATGAYVVTGTQWTGTSTYNCGPYGTMQGNFYPSPYWTACSNQWGGSCPCAGDVMTTGCYIHGQWGQGCNGNIE